VRRSRRRSPCQLQPAVGPLRWASPSVDVRGLRRQPRQSPGPGRLRASRRPSLGRSGGAPPAAACRPAGPQSPVPTPFPPLKPPRGHTGRIRGRRGQRPASKSQGRPRPNRWIGDVEPRVAAVDRPWAQDHRREVDRGDCHPRPAARGPPTRGHSQRRGHRPGAGAADRCRQVGVRGPLCDLCRVVTKHLGPPLIPEAPIEAVR